MDPIVSRYRLTATLVAFCGLSIWATPATAHGLHATEHGISLSTVVAVSALLSISAGVVAAVGRHTQRAERHTQWISLLVGLVIVSLGLTAAGSVVIHAPSTAAIGGFVGLAAGLAVVIHSSCNGCADMTAGAIGLHRLVEGVAVAGLWAAGTAVGFLGVIVFAGHMAVECVAIGMQQSFSRLRAIGAVIAVTGIFVFGVGIGLVGGAALPTHWAVAVVGGLLIPLGAAEIKSDDTTQAVPTPT